MVLFLFCLFLVLFEDGWLWLGRHLLYLRLGALLRVSSRHCLLQVHVAVLVEHDLRYHLVQLVQGVSQPLLQLDGHEVGLVGPPLETFGDQVVGKSLKLLIRVLHLIVLGVEDDTLLDLLDV